MFTFDIKNEFEALKAANLCKKCGKLYKSPVILKTCDHIACADCALSPCATCGKGKGIKSQATFTQNVVARINNIENFFKQSRNADYRIERLPKSILGNYDNSQNTRASSGSLPVPPPVKKRKVGRFECAEIGPGSIVVVPTVKKNPKGETALHVACKRKQLEKVKKLLEEGVDVNCVDWANWTPLHEAVQSGSYECAAALIDAGALTSVPGQFYTTPLHQASDANLTSIVNLLLSNGADPNIPDYSGKKPTLDVISKCETSEAPLLFVEESKEVFVSAVSGTCMNRLWAQGLTHVKFDRKKNVFLLVVGNDENLYTYQTLASLVKGAIIIRENSLVEYLNGFPIAPDLIPEEIKATSLRAIRNRLHRKPKLFDGMNFHVTANLKPLEIKGGKIAREQLASLIEIAGGCLLVRPPAERTVECGTFYPFHARGKDKLERCCHFIVYDEGEAPMLLYNMADLRHVSSRWVVECVLKFEILDV